MNRRAIIAIGITVALLALAGCTQTVGTDDPEETVVKSDNNIEVSKLEVFSDGQRDCYHTFDAVVKNNNSHAITNLELTVTISDENDQILSRFNTGYTQMDANETKNLEVEHGPQKNQCWFSGDADDYTITATYNTTD